MPLVHETYILKFKIYMALNANIRFVKICFANIFTKN